MAQIQAQLAQSPLVAVDTARGLPPPASAINQAVGPDLASTLQTLGMGGGMSSLPQVTPYQSQWGFSQQGPGVAPLGGGSYGGFGSGPALTTQGQIAPQNLAQDYSTAGNLYQQATNGEGQG